VDDQIVAAVLRVRVVVVAFVLWPLRAVADGRDPAGRDTQVREVRLGRARALLAERQVVLGGAELVLLRTESATSWRTRRPSSLSSDESKSKNTAGSSFCFGISAGSAGACATTLRVGGGGAWVTGRGVATGGFSSCEQPTAAAKLRDSAPASAKRDEIIGDLLVESWGP
jgi:hypothetical protein